MTHQLRHVFLHVWLLFFRPSGSDTSLRGLPHSFHPRDDNPQLRLRVLVESVFMLVYTKEDYPLDPSPRRLADLFIYLLVDRICLFLPSRGIDPRFPTP